MSDVPPFGEVGSRERLLWQAVLRLDDYEIGDQLFALVAHQRLSRADTELVARELSHLSWPDGHRWSPLLLASIVPCGLLLLLVILSVLEFRDAAPFDLAIIIFLVSMTLCISPAFLLAIPCLLTWNKGQPHLPDGLLWAECHARFPQLLESLRVNSFVKRMPIPTEWQIVWAIAQVISQAEQPSTSDGGANSHAIPPSTVSLFKELLNQLPSYVDESEMYQWIKSLDANDWHARFLVRYAMRMPGISAMHTLNERFTLHDWAPINYRNHKWHVILWQDNTEVFPCVSAWMCIRCLNRFATHNITFGGEKFKFNVCRSCRKSRYAHKVTQSVCVIDRRFASDNIKGVMIDSEGVLHRDPASQSRAAPMVPWPPSTTPRILFMPWSSVQRPFDFELLYIGDTDDQEIEQFIAKCLADSDEVWKGLRTTIAVRVAHPERLSANSLNLVRRFFPQARGTTGNSAEMAKLDSLIAWTAPAVAAEVLS